MALKGELKTMLLPDVLQWLSQNLKTGILHVRSPKGITKKVFFKNGNILSTASSDPREYLGQFLISRGLVTEKQLNMAMETQFQTGIKLGKILIMAGILEEKELEEMLKLKAEETLYDLFLWEEGEFIFEELEDIKEDFVPISLDVTSLILEGIRRKDEWKRISKVIKTLRLVFRKKSGVDLGNCELEPMELRLYEELDGKKCLEEIALELHSTDFNVAHAAYNLFKKGLIELVGKKKEDYEKSLEKIHSQIIDEAKKLISEEKLIEAINLLKFHLRKNEDKDAEKLLKYAEEKYQRKNLKETIPMNAVLELAVPIEELPKFNLTPKEGFIATRINGIWDISAIVKVSPMPEMDVLASIKKILDLGIARIKNPK